MCLLTRTDLCRRYGKHCETHEQKYKDRLEEKELAAKAQVEHTVNLTNECKKQQDELQRLTQIAEESETQRLLGQQRLLQLEEELRLQKKAKEQTRKTKILDLIGNVF
jgi:hypothetical protein